MAPQDELAQPSGDPVSSDDGRASDDAIRAFVTRLARPGPDGRRVIERAAIMAEGATAAAILDWLAAASWVPEEVPVVDAQTGGSGLHGMRREPQRGWDRPQPPRRYVSPAP